MKKILSVLFFSFLILTIIFSTGLKVSAQTTGHQQSVNCFDYYKFQSAQVDVGPDKQTYLPGETIKFTGQVKNQNSYPVFDGYIFARIGEKNPNFTTKGLYIVDEFVPVGKIAIDTNSSKSVSFSWQIPKSLEKGDYEADFFFSVGEKFNLGGLPFTNEIIVGSANFSVGSTQMGKVYFDKSTTKVNGQKYQHIGNWPVIAPGKSAVITQTLKNTNSDKQNISISYDLYFWDSLNPADKINSKQESITLDPNSNKELSYTIPAVNESVYYLKITALSSGGQKSIINIKIASAIERPKANFSAITKFPLQKGDSFNLFSCFYNTSTLSTTGRVLTTLQDKNGNEIGKIDYSGNITSAMSAEKISLSSVKNYTDLVLKQEIYDKAGKLVDSYSSNLSCALLDSAKCREMTAKLPVNLAGLTSILLIILLLLIALYVARKYKAKNVVLAVIICFLIIVALAILAFQIEQNYFEQASAANGTFGATTQTSQSGTSTAGYDFGWNHWSHNVSCTDERPISSGNVSVTNNITRTGSTTLWCGDSISFSDLRTCTDNINGGAWDTPYCGSSIRISDAADPKNYGYVNWSAPGSSPAITVSSNSPSVISCSGRTCTGQGAGTAVISTTAPSTTENFDACAYFEQSGMSFLTGGDNLGCTDGTTCYNATTVDCTPPTNSARYVGFNDGNGCYDNTNLSANLDGYSADWNVVVSCPIVSCSASPSSATAGSQVIWTATGASGGIAPYTYTWSGDENLSGNTSSVQKTYSTAGTKTASVTVTDSTGHSSTSIPCTNSATISMAASCSGSPNPATTGTPVIWAATASGGATPYTYTWSGVVSGSGSSKTSTAVTGTNTANITATDAKGFTGSGSCHITATASPISARCTVFPASASVGATITWNVSSNGVSGTPTYAWTGACTGSGTSCAKSFASAGMENTYITVTDSSGNTSGPVTCPAVGVTATTTSCYDENAPTSPKPLNQVFDLSSTHGQGLFAYFPFDNNSANDAEGNIIWTTPPPLVSSGSIFSGGASFSGNINNEAFSYSNLNLGTGSFSACTWFNQACTGLNRYNPPDTTCMTHQQIFGLRNGDINGNGPGQGGFEVQLDNRLAGGIGTFEAGVSSDGLFNVDGVGISPLPTLHNWHYSCFVRDDNNLASGVKLYMDGTLVSANTNNLRNVNYPYFILGNDNINRIEPFDGQLDDVSIWKRALSDCEVKSLYLGTDACLTPCPSCGSCASTTDCASTCPYCVSGSCKTNNNPGCGTCTTSADCASTCSDCVSGHCTNTPQCGSCASTADCASSCPYCVSGTCNTSNTPGCGTCTSSADCASTCSDCVSGHCTTPSCGSSCSSSAECPVDCPSCSLGVCSAPPATCGSCDTNSDCASGCQYCVSSQCVSSSCNASCTSNSDCGTGCPNCVSGHCSPTCGSCTTATASSVCNSSCPYCVANNNANGSSCSGNPAAGCGACTSSANCASTCSNCAANANGIGSSCSSDTLGCGSCNSSEDCASNCQYCISGECSAVSLSSQGESHNYCDYGAGAGAIWLNWTTSPSGAQASYTVRLYSNKTYSGSPTPYTSSANNGQDSSLLFMLGPDTGGGANYLPFGQDYSWKVQVADDFGKTSGWVAGGTFSTPSHASPAPSFNTSPISAPLTNSIANITFTDNNSQCYNTDGTNYSCNTKSANSYAWTFGDGQTSSAANPPVHAYYTATTYNTGLTVCDEKSYCCTATGTVTISPTGGVPTWKEIPPQ